MDEITIGEKVYISSKRAAKITGYAKDYVGQLCREGRVEARLVGRSWYVLESAIREHRFGKPADVTTQEAPAEEPVDRIATWQKPQYAPETPITVPSLVERPAAESIGTPAIADMQTAWREWFAEKKQSEPVVEQQETAETAAEIEEDLAPEMEEENAVASDEMSEPLEEERVPVQRVYSDAPVQRFQAPRSLDIAPAQPAFTTPDTIVSSAVTAARPARKEKGESQGLGSAAVRALLVAIAFLSVLVGVIGTGHAEKFLSGTSIDFGIQSSVIDYLGGTSVYKSSL